MAAFVFDDAVRWARVEPRRPLSRRPDLELPFVTEEPLSGPPLLLDTCVYIDQLQERTPVLVERLIRARQTNHSTVAIQEMMHTVGVLDPAHPKTAGAIAAIRAQVTSMSATRTFAPDADVLGRAALIAGKLRRLRDHAGDARPRALQDCVLFLQALKQGFTVLTANLADFDILLQLVPAGRVLFYRKT